MRRLLAKLEGEHLPPRHYSWVFDEGGLENVNFMVNNSTSRKFSD
jgi:hypothetical protein